VLDRPALLVAGFLVSALLAGPGATGQSSRKNTFPWFDKPSTPPVYPQIGVGVAGLSSHLKSPGTVVLDVRQASLYEAGHIPGASRFPAGMAPGDLETARDLLGRQGISGLEELVLYGDTRNLREVGRAFLVLESLGCARVKVLEGGIDAWRAARGPVETSVRSRPPRRFEASPGQPILVDLPWMQTHYGEPGVEILDVRDDPGGWRGQDYEAPPLFRDGHVPHSLPFDFGTLLTGKGRLPRPATARATFARLGPRPATPVDLDATFVVYGRDAGDARTGLAYLLLRRMGIQARVFAGGWEAWSASSDSPIVHILSTAELAFLLKAEPPHSEGDRITRTFVLFDLREDWDFRSGHIPGACSVPFHLFAQSLETLIASHWPGVDRSQVPVVFYCYGRECIRSREGSTIAAKSGFRKLYWYRDGLAAWRKAGRELLGEPNKAGDVRRIFGDAPGSKKPPPRR
jgi:thiosulfate/3-mercaptopyruvate sulfurtransferase